MGTFGRAFVVHRVADKKALSMKEFSFADLDWEERQSALREVQALTSLKHPYIIRYVEKFMHDSQLCMVFDEGDYGNLWTFVRQNSRQRTVIPEPQVVRWFTQICLAVKYLHERSHPILHRDIKTQNIFLGKKDKEGTVAKLFAEFGPMKVLENPGAEVRASIGTHFCQCPEITNRKPYGTAADVWALGCVLYEMCAAHQGWEAEDIPDHMENILISPLFHITDKYSSELGLIAGTMLTHDPSQRPSADAVLKTPLLQDEMRKMLNGRHKAAAKPVEAPHSHRNGAALYTEHREGAARDEIAAYMEHHHQCDYPYSARSDSYNAKDPESSVPSHVRPLGDHNPRMPCRMSSASPGVVEAAKLLLVPDSPRSGLRAPSPTPTSAASIRPRTFARVQSSPREQPRESSCDGVHPQASYVPSVASARPQSWRASSNIASSSRPSSRAPSADSPLRVTRGSELQRPRTSSRAPSPDSLLQGTSGPESQRPQGSSRTPRSDYVLQRNSGAEVQRPQASSRAPSSDSPLQRASGQALQRPQRPQRPRAAGPSSARSRVSSKSATPREDAEDVLASGNDKHWDTAREALSRLLLAAPADFSDCR